MTVFKAAAVLALVGLSACSATVSGGSGGAGPNRFIASNNMVVYGDPSVPGRFEVQQRAGRGGSDYWCAAGEYAIQGMGVGPASRIYLETPYGAGYLSNSGKTAGFTVAPDAQLQAAAAAQSNGLTMSIKRVGENWGAEHARTQCPTFFDPLR
ncbi:hypothetical protein ACFE33_13110 [Falsihalocynthiibacter sp. SS001]|uniref:hypothetical protein n=1 Tax=Falsihalocynthiibacter sp. SS001 TaxID=3349698 RepID=UPI0036D40401